MPKMSDKEKCFQEAWDKYKDATGNKDMDIESQKPWGQRPDGSWNSKYSSWQHLLNSFLKGATEQMRFPDLTVTNGGKTSVLDLKFTRSDGTVDTWRTNPGAGNGNLQRQDYNTINEQQNGGRNPYSNEDPSLDPEKCGCGKGTKVQQEEVVKEVPAMGMYGMPLLESPNGLPSFGLGGAGAGGMVPEFVIP
ncbi:hypothetical protein BLA50215_00958 [Burkholderia lata]|uniref:hypothetical protein n=1 Tax=Burkholderia lata (strain ATCC 17760 / DSM 23089 / LMG 22485 / NCIMB 9086 / R18194 / 383) TaxID=482957 RepID=UPI0014534414|nr:hypothetical protein [Burkholderia lata]VWC77014.1 hypothetical protein BLA50215_00958 [Burkholderia lata]